MRAARIETEGCKVEELTSDEQAKFARAVAPMMLEAEKTYGASMLRSVER